MNIITATQLRTRTKELVESLLSGEEVSLIHRSKVIGIFKPKKDAVNIFDSRKVMKISEKLNYSVLTNVEIDKKYRQAMIKKHGKHLHRHQFSL